MPDFSTAKFSFDKDAFPAGKRAGDNKFGFTICPTCKAEPETVIFSDGDELHVFPFRDDPSAREYYISGMCQACQDSVFGKGA